MRKLIILLLILGLIKFIVGGKASEKSNEEFEINRFYSYQNSIKSGEDTQSFNSLRDILLDNYHSEIDREDWDASKINHSAEPIDFMTYFLLFSKLLQKYYPEFQFDTLQNQSELSDSILITFRNEMAIRQFQDFYEEKGIKFSYLTNPPTVKGMVKGIKSDEINKSLTLTLLPFKYSKNQYPYQCISGIDTIKILNNPIHRNQKLEKFYCSFTDSTIINAKYDEIEFY